MNKIKHVLVFEYMQVVKSKGFLITTFILSVLLLCVGVIPTIVGVVQDKFFNDESKCVAYIDLTGQYNKELLSQYFPEYEWVHHEINELDDVKEKIESKEYKFGLKINDSLSYDLILASSLTTKEFGKYDDMIKEVYQKDILLDKLTVSETNELLNVEISSDIILLGKNGSEGYALAYVVLMIVFIMLANYGNLIAASVVTEKTSRTIEIIFTSAKPTDIIFGKVFGVGMAIITQCIGFAFVFYLSMLLSSNTMVSGIYDQVFNILVGNHLYIYIFTFFIFGFFSYSFLFAATGATAKEAQDVNKTTVIPVILMIVGFYIAMFYIGASSRLPEELIKALSFTPFISPFIMIVRLCTTELAFYEILIAILVNIGTIVLSGMISAKIYKTNIMMYGSKVSLKNLLIKQ